MTTTNQFPSHAASFIATLIFSIVGVNRSETCKNVGQFKISIPKDQSGTL
jgi:hypothetical protein